MAPGTSAASVGTSVRSDSWVAMIALSIEVFWNPGRVTGLSTISCGLWAQPYEIVAGMLKLWACRDLRWKGCRNRRLLPVLAALGQASTGKKSNKTRTSLNSSIERDYMELAA